MIAKVAPTTASFSSLNFFRLPPLNFYAEEEDPHGGFA